MIGFPNIIPQMPAATDGTPADEQLTRPQAGETTGPQTTVQWPLGYGLPGANGGSCANPCGFPNYGRLYIGTYNTYDWMLEHPTIQHARSQVFDPIISSTPGYESLKGVSDKRKDFIKGQMDCIWQQVGDILRALDYGWAPFEKIWRVTGGRYEIECLKPLNVEYTGIVTDPHGAFAGLAPNNTQSKADWLGVHKSFLYTYDAKFGNLYGRSRMENMRATAWRDWLDAATDLVKLSKKISGKLGLFSTPAGTFKLPGVNGQPGVEVKWSDVAQAAANALNQDSTIVHVPHMGSNSIVTGQQNFDQAVELMKVRAVSLEMVDFGSNAPAITGLMERMKANEERMFAGYFQSPRTGMATQGGTKADAQQHTDTATLNAENVAGGIARELSRQLIDDILVLNFGESARGSVWMTPAKLTDDNVATDMAIIEGVITNPDGLGTKFLTQVDLNPIADRRGISHDQPIKLEEPLIVPPIKGAIPNDPNAPMPPNPPTPDPYAP